MPRPSRPRRDSSCDDFKVACVQLSPTNMDADDKGKSRADERPVTPSRARSGLENLLSAGMVRRGKASPRPPPSPHMDRSISSMGDSFVDHWGTCHRNNPEIDATPATIEDAVKDEALTPITNWAHLNYIKSQRNSLREDLKAHQIAGAEAKRSVASLRRLAFRMAVNISVKEKQIATSARNLARSRKSNYLEGRDAEQRVEELKRALRIEEGRNREILEALERASMLTLQCKISLLRGSMIPLTRYLQMPIPKLSQLNVASEIRYRLHPHPLRGCRLCP